MGRHRMSNIGACGVFDMAGRWCSAVFVVGRGMDMVARLARSRPSQARSVAKTRGRVVSRLRVWQAHHVSTTSPFQGSLVVDFFLVSSPYACLTGGISPEIRRILSSLRTQHYSLNIHSRVHPEARLPQIYLLQDCLGIHQGTSYTHCIAGYIVSKLDFATIQQVRTRLTCHDLNELIDPASGICR